MKVAAILEDKITVGGGFNQALNAIFQMRDICKGRFDFEVLTTRSENIKTLQQVDLSAVEIKLTFIDRWFINLSTNPLWLLIRSALNSISPFETKLIKQKVDLVYFLTQSKTPAVLTRLNYITTVFDLCHRDMQEFPEVGQANIFYSREIHFKNNLPRATLIITSSDQLSHSISRRYGIDYERLLSMPFAPSHFLTERTSDDKSKVLNHYQLTEGYFFYPAQFWAHKNHILILEALLILKEKGIKYEVVFVGSDQGNLAHVQRFISRHSLGEQVRLLGFAPAEHMRGLYEGCLALVMPTYFGPTNLPPLEAWTIGKPVIYSAHLNEHAGNAAIFINPEDPRDLAEAMQTCTNPQTCEELIKAGETQLKKINLLRQNAAIELFHRLENFATKRRCWA